MTTAIETTMVTKKGDPLWQMEANMEASGSRSEPRVQKNESRLFHYGIQWFIIYMGLSENSVPLNPMVNDHYPVFKWLFVWEYTLFSDKPIYLNI